MNGTASSAERLQQSGGNRLDLVGLLTALTACSAAIDPAKVRPLAEPPPEVTVADAADRLLATDPRVILLGEHHYDVATIAFATDLVEELAKRGELDLLVLEEPWSNTAGWAAGTLTRAATTHESEASRHRLVALAQAHGFAVIATDIEHDFPARAELEAAVEEAGHEVPDKLRALLEIADTLALSPHLTRLRERTRETLDVYALTERTYWPVRQELVLDALLRDDQGATRFVDGQRVVVWGGALHTATGSPCDDVRWEGCYLAHEAPETKGQTVSLHMESPWLDPEWLQSADLSSCEGTLAGKVGWYRFAQRVQRVARAHPGRFIQTGSYRDIRAAAGAGGPVWMPGDDVGHDHRIVFPTSTLARGICETSD